ncbi:MAG: transcriptional regulator, MarR family [Rhizorhabdus sp.]|nr:transcriptional regulator, MarR family [Rhizorhabdus sp.]
MFMTVPSLVHDIGRAARYRFDARTRNIGITRPQWRMLLVLARLDGPSQSEVAELLEVERITLCRMVDRLAEAGLVERRADPTDRRIWRLHLTEKSRPLVEQLSGIAAELEHDMLAVLKPEERRTLIDLLVRVRGGMRICEEEADTEKTNRAVA